MSLSFRALSSALGGHSARRLCYSHRARGTGGVYCSLRAISATPSTPSRDAWRGWFRLGMFFLRVLARSPESLCETLPAPCSPYTGMLAEKLLGEGGRHSTLRNRLDSNCSACVVSCLLFSPLPHVFLSGCCTRCLKHLSSFSLDSFPTESLLLPPRTHGPATKRAKTSRRDY